MWLMGAILMWFSITQSNMTVERLFGNPPQQVQKEINDMGPDVARQLFRFQASLFERRVRETWEIIQLGLLGALLAISVLTAHRSRIVIAATALMILFVLVQAFYITPLMAGLGRSFDFLPQTAALAERQAFARFLIYYRTLDVMKVLLVMATLSRLLFDFYDFGSVVLPWSKAPVKRKRRLRRNGPRPVPSSQAGSAGAPAAGVLPDQQEDPERPAIITPPPGSEPRE
jgi:hypothetical protein